MTLKTAITHYGAAKKRLWMDGVYVTIDSNGDYVDESGVLYDISELDLKCKEWEGIRTPRGVDLDDYSQYIDGLKLN